MVLVVVFCLLAGHVGQYNSVVNPRIALILMPIVGLVLLCNKDPGKRTWGWILFILGVIL